MIARRIKVLETVERKVKATGEVVRTARLLAWTDRSQFEITLPVSEEEKATLDALPYGANVTLSIAPAS